MVVAAGAAHRHRHPYGGYRLDAVDHVLDVVLLGNRAALEVDHVVAIEARGNELIAGRIGQQVARDLLDGELVERLVFVEGANHPIAPRPHLAAAVDVVTVRVGVTRQVEPFQRHALAVAPRAQQTVDLLFIGFRRTVVKKGGDILGVGRQAGEIEAQAAQQGAFVRLGRGRQIFFAKPGADELVDGTAAAAVERLIRPMGPPFGALIDPAANCLDLLRSGAAVGRRRRHARRFIDVADAPVQPARGGVAGNDHAVAAAVGERAVARVQPQTGLAGLLIGPVTGEALIRQDRPHVLLEIDGLVARRRPEQQRGKSELQRYEFQQAALASRWGRPRTPSAGSLPVYNRGRQAARNDAADRPRTDGKTHSAVRSGNCGLNSSRACIRNP